jgi:uncharacterized protein YndB with AHSA1/START domain
MNARVPLKPDPRLDLVLERVVDVPAPLIWEAWTKPEHLRQWFAPAPWTIVDCELDLRPGGAFRFVMRDPEGNDTPNVGCVLEVIPKERLVWTDALLPGYRPAENPFFTAVVTMEPKGSGTKYTAIAIHRDEATRKAHEKMGFHEGWGQTLDQLVALMKKKTTSRSRS